MRKKIQVKRAGVHFVSRLSGREVVLNFSERLQKIKEMRKRKI